MGSQIFPKKEETLLNFVNKCFVQVIYSALILVFCKCIEDSIPREHSKNKKTFRHSSAQHRESDGAIIVKIEILLKSMKYGKPREAGKGRDVIC